MRVKLDRCFIKEYHDARIDTIGQVLDDLEELSICLGTKAMKILEDLVQNNSYNKIAIYLKNYVTGRETVIIYTNSKDTEDSFNELLINGYIDATDSFMKFDLTIDV